MTNVMNLNWEFKESIIFSNMNEIQSLDCDNLSYDSNLKTWRYNAKVILLRFENINVTMNSSSYKSYYKTHEHDVRNMYYLMASKLCVTPFISVYIDVGDLPTNANNISCTCYIEGNNNKHWPVEMVALEIEDIIPHISLLQFI